MRKRSQRARTSDDRRRQRATKATARDSSVVEAALEALIRSHRSAAIDAAYAVAYSRTPLSDPDEWGDLASWRTGASAP